MTMREENMGHNEDESVASTYPQYLIFCLKPSLLENQPVMRHIFSNVSGISAVIASDNTEMLPKECKVIVSTESDSEGIYFAQGTRISMKFEMLSEQSAETFARKLAPMRVKDSVESSAIPTLVGFLETYGARNAEDVDVWRYWMENHAYQGLKSIIGIGASGREFILDISDKHHGPHGLVAGTTGSGKSVMLETYILSLVLCYHPSEVQLILIDYKGGGMANSFRRLPHVAGVIDNLDGERRIMRALSSIKSEILRRETSFKRVGVNNIDDYMKLYDPESGEPSYAHLIIIVDEFAELKTECPAFIHELVSASRVGRSVGIHLILSTQKPSNTVDNEIWSNTRFRICLRVADRSDSVDMLKRPDAAYLKGMGRCYVQVGNNEVFEQVQTCYSGAEYAPDELKSDEVPCLLDDMGRPMKLKRKRVREGKKITEMDAVLGRIYDTVKEHAVPSADRLWLDELPSTVTLENLAREGRRFSVDGAWDARQDLCAEIGKADDLSHQRYLTVSFDFLADHNILITGASATGKTTTLITTAVSLADTYSPDQLNMYFFSLTGSTPRCLSALPHMGDVVDGEDVAEVVRLLHMLLRENDRRITLFAEAAVGSFESYNAASEKGVCAIVVFVDRMEQLRASLSDADFDNFMALVREGGGRGIFFVVAAMSTAEIPHKIKTYFSGRPLNMSAREEYADVLNVRIPADFLGIRADAGRGVTNISGMLMETQYALANAESADRDRYLAIQRLGEAMCAQWNGALPKRIPRIAQNVTWDDVYQDPSCESALKDPWLMPLAYNVLEGQLLIANMHENSAWLIVGGKRSGKSTYLAGIATIFARKGAKVLLMTRSGVIAKDAVENLTICDVSNDAWKTFFAEIRTVGHDRAVRLKEAQAKGAAARTAEMRGFTPYVVLLDDLEYALPKMESSQTDLLGFVCREAADLAIFLFASVSHLGLNVVRGMEPYRSLCTVPNGIKIGGSLAEFNPWNFSVPYAIRQKQMDVGEGLIVIEGRTMNVILPRLKEEM